VKLYEALAAMGPDDRITRPGGPVVRKGKGDDIHSFLKASGERFEPTTTECIVGDWDLVRESKD
jgi:hypothetical protein